MKRCTSAAAAARAFNDAHAIGTRVRYWPGRREGEARESKTRTAASVVGGHTAVVWVEGYSGCVALSHIEALA